MSRHQLAREECRGAPPTAQPRPRSQAQPRPMSRHQLAREECRGAPPTAQPRPRSQGAGRAPEAWGSRPGTRGTLPSTAAASPRTGTSQATQHVLVHHGGDAMANSEPAADCDIQARHGDLLLPHPAHVTGLWARSLVPSKQAPQQLPRHAAA
ncbi:unnamed protein product [Prorocentrum cordatum]|uniref:Uncharacterized protein n=1 Tax=Prorocentrum cordatum TaxID=2364126 RepID=A0ABN9Q0J2_9DINO|nr:unnamed protein product [Polarella glacialis]